MKKLIILFCTLVLLAPATMANQQDMQKLAQSGFFASNQATKQEKPYYAVKKLLKKQLKYSNSHDMEGLSELYAPNYVSGDGMKKEVFEDLVTKTWKSYPDIRYFMVIRDIDASETRAVAHVDEFAFATSADSRGLSIVDKGLLESSSSTAYYLEKVNNVWQIVSDHINYEKTFLRYGQAKFIDIDLDAPNQIYAGTPYTASLTVNCPKNVMVIASVGNEKVTYPQETAPEVFRKVVDGNLERMFTSNTKNINEYAVSSFGVTKAEMKGKDKLRVSITGLGFAMSRVNVVPQNNYVKPVEQPKLANTDKSSKATNDVKTSEKQVKTDKSAKTDKINNAKQSPKQSPKK